MDWLWLIVPLGSVAIFMGYCEYRRHRNAALDQRVADYNAEMDKIINERFPDGSPG